MMVLQKSVGRYPLQIYFCNPIFGLVCSGTSTNVSNANYFEINFREKREIQLMDNERTVVIQYTSLATFMLGSTDQLIIETVMMFSNLFLIQCFTSSDSIFRRRMKPIC